MSLDVFIDEKSKPHVGHYVNARDSLRLSSTSLCAFCSMVVVWVGWSGTIVRILLLLLHIEGTSWNIMSWILMWNGEG